MFKIFKIVQSTIYGIILILIAIWIVAQTIKGYISSIPSFIISILFLSLMGYLFILSIKENNKQ